MRVTSPIIGAALAAALSSAGLVEAVPAAAAAPAAHPDLPTPGLIERAVRRGSIDRARGNLLLAYAFARPEKLPRAYRSDVPWEGTVPLLELQRAQRAMPPGPARSEIADLLSGETGPGWCGPYSAGSLASNTTTEHFHVEYGSVGGGLSIDSYTDALEQSWTTEVGAFGWAAPPMLPANPPPGNVYHVRVDDLPTGLYGYVTVSGAYAGLVGDNPSTAWDDTDSFATCMVLRNDYSDFPSSPQDSLNATVAHEFNHSIQFGYGALHGSNRPDYVFIEGGATWMEDEVFDSANDNYLFLWPAFAESMGDYDGSFFGYDYWVTFRGLTERFGSGGEQIMQDFWEETSKNNGNNLTALQSAMAKRGTTLADAFHEYAIAVKFNRPCVSGYVYPYCLREGPDYVAVAGPTGFDGVIASIGGSHIGTVEDNYAINWVRLPTGPQPYPLKLLNASAGGQLRASVVCDTGSLLRATAFPAVVGSGASTQLSAFDPSGCKSVAAVITNEAQTAPNPVESETRSYLLTTDTTPPSGPPVKGPGLLQRFLTQRDVELAWEASGAVNYDVRQRSAPHNADFANFVTWVARTPGTGGVFTGEPGRTYCFSARATDAALNISDFGAEGCTAIPLNNTALRHQGPWTKKKGKGYFLETFSNSRSQGATLELRNVRARRLALVATKCPGCGSVKVFLGRKLLRTLRLGASSIKRKQVFGLAYFDEVRGGRLRVVVATSGRPVKIEGVGVSRL
ncbi:MAG TPA: hypothetical protein VGZ50_04455 [Actinomycetota bacterium]|nr:hypothetical protein [Actinomycetota bacterium]